MFSMQSWVPRDEGVRYQRWIMARGVLLAAPAAGLIWLAVYKLAPPLAGLGDTSARLAFALRCCAVVVLLCYVPAIEAVAHRRFVGSPSDLAAGQAPQRRYETRFLQHTIEQLLLFVPGLLGLASYCRDGAEMRSVLAATIAWMISRAVFRLGYHHGASTRGAGLIGMVQSVLILMYVSARFGYDLMGVVGAAIPLALVFGLEAYIVARRRRR